MCFSAQASFAASLILLIVGGKALEKARSKSEYLFASIPLLFAIQQFAEGFVWLSATSAQMGLCQTSATYAFLFFALIVWPTWIPLSLYLMEKEKLRKKILLIASSLGMIFSTGMLYILMYYGAFAAAVSRHILYTINVDVSVESWSLALYCIPVILPFFVSSKKYIWLFGLTILISLAITTILWYQYLTSIWCFFAALLSLFVLALVGKNGHTRAETNA